MRATTRACAAAVAVQRPRLTGNTFSSAQRFKVDGETPARRAASLRDMRSSVGILPASLAIRSVAVPARLRPTAPIAPEAILVGDPGRALLLAQELLEQPKMSNHARGLWGYSGSTPEDHALTIQSTGIGGPSAALVLADLAELGVKRVSRSGGCS